MKQHELSPEELWARQGIRSRDVDYRAWNHKRESLRQMSQISGSCLFTVDVWKARYDFASNHFATLFGYNLRQIESIHRQGDLLEERIHPDDRDQLRAFQIEHGKFIYSLPAAERNDYRQTFQFRILDKHRHYVNVVSRQQVVEKDKTGKAWIVMGMMDIAPDQTPGKQVKRSVIHIPSGDLVTPVLSSVECVLTDREKEILVLMARGMLSKEIAYKLNISIYTVHNHRKNILAKLGVDHAIEAVNVAYRSGWLG